MLAEEDDEVVLVPDTPPQEIQQGPAEVIPETPPTALVDEGELNLSLKVGFSILIHDIDIKVIFDL